MIHSTPNKEDSLASFLSDSERISGIGPLSDSRAEAGSNGRRVIALDIDLLERDGDDEESRSCKGARDMSSIEPENVFYRRKIVPLEESPGDQVVMPTGRQWEKVKQNKESDNRNRQSLVSNSSDNTDYERFYNKSSHGKWKRRKGPAPSLPVPPKRGIPMLPIEEIRHELEVIEVQQQGLEKQGVQLEKIIREKTEGGDSGIATSLSALEFSVGDAGGSVLSGSMKNTKEVEDLIMQLLDLVVEKNELFRRQAELMYLRRQHRLEQEQADLEYEIRVLMAQPECNKTDSDKAKEEAMIGRLVEVVQQRNEVVDCLEMDRLREVQEDLVSDR